MLPDKNKLSDEALDEVEGGFSVMTLIGKRGKRAKKFLSVQYVKDTGVCPDCGKKLVNNPFDHVFPFKCPGCSKKFTGNELVEANDDNTSLSL